MWDLFRFGGLFFCIHSSLSLSRALLGFVYPKPRSLAMTRTHFPYIHATAEENGLNSVFISERALSRIARDKVSVEFGGAIIRAFHLPIPLFLRNKNAQFEFARSLFELTNFKRFYTGILKTKEFSASHWNSRKRFYVFRSRTDWRREKFYVINNFFFSLRGIRKQNPRNLKKE